MPTLTEEVFQDTMLKGFEEQRKANLEHKTQFSKVTEDLGNADKEVKKAIEELTKVKNVCNDQAAILTALRKAQGAIALNVRSSFTDPVKRLLANEDMRAYFNILPRALNCRSEGDYKNLPADWRSHFEAVNAKNKSLTGVDAGLGQATVPQETFNEIYDTLLEFGQWNTLGVMRVGMRTVVVPLATARPQFYWLGSGTGGTGEGGTIAAGSFTGSSVTGIIQTLAAYLTVARELLADSTVDLAPYIVREMMISIAQGMDTAAFIGTGAADQVSAGYYGIFNIGSVNANLVSTAALGNTSVATTQLDDWVNVLLTVSPEVLKRAAKWWMHPQVQAQAILVRDKNGRPIFQTWTEVPNQKSLTSILGYPVVLTDIAPSPIGTAPSNSVAAFGDPEGQAVMVRSDLELATSDDINFPQNMRAYRTLMRAGVKPKTIAASTTLKPLAVFNLAAQ